MSPSVAIVIRGHEGKLLLQGKSSGDMLRKHAPFDIVASHFGIHQLTELLHTMHQEKLGFSTNAIHAGYDPNKYDGALKIVAEFLERSSYVKKVHYPGLQSYSQYDLARRQMKQPGGMIAFELKGGIEAGKKFINSLRLCARSLSLGDAESLALHPVSMMETVYAQKNRRDSLIDDGLVRLSVGLEDVEDLLADLEHALNVLA